mmetsp:Transcript_20186/g.60276  ORF Transcript_20186/g.60276 Transcript_20186/m.60276 type:complete len:226 (+) Transcript_20186:764-1441(+)
MSTVLRSAAISSLESKRWTFPNAAVNSSQLTVAASPKLFSQKSRASCLTMVLLGLNFPSGHTAFSSATMWLNASVTLDSWRRYGPSGFSISSPASLKRSMAFLQCALKQLRKTRMCRFCFSSSNEFSVKMIVSRSSVSTKMDGRYGGLFFRAIFREADSSSSLCACLLAASLVRSEMAAAIRSAGPFLGNILRMRSARLCPPASAMVHSFRPHWPWRFHPLWRTP